MGDKVQKETEMGAEMDGKNMVARRTAKDTVFCDLFRDKK